MHKILLPSILILASSVAPVCATQHAGEKIFEQSCAACHGSDGTGAIAGVPDLTQFKGFKSGENSDAALFEHFSHVKQGIKSSGPISMPPKGGNPNLTDQDIRDVLKYMREKFTGKIAYADNPQNSDQFVSRQEYEKLKEEMRVLKEQMQALLKDKSQVVSRKQAVAVEEPNVQSKILVSKELDTFKQAVVVEEPSTPSKETVANKELDTLKLEVKTLRAKTESLMPGLTSFLLTGYGFAGFTDSENSNSSFNAGFNPIFLWRPLDNLLFEAEVEFELEDTETHVELELAQMSYLLNDYITVGVGKFFNPSNYFIERLHPLWINKLPDQPITMVGSTRLQANTQLGVQVRGGVPIGQTRGEYAFYASNGPTMRADGTLSFDNFTDINSNKAIGGRLGWLPFPNFGFGYGFEVSAVDDLNGASLYSVTHVADLNYQKTSKRILGSIDVRAQYARRHVERSSSPMLAFNNLSSGGYAQIAYRPILSSLQLIRNLESVLRYDWIDRPSSIMFSDEQRWAIGLNYYLADRTILKFAYRFDDKKRALDSDTLFFQAAMGF